MEKWCDSQWQTGLQPGCSQTCGINIAWMGANMAEVQTVDVTMDVTVIVTMIMIMSMDVTVGVDTKALE